MTQSSVVETMGTGAALRGRTLRVAISAIGRFHMFDLAHQMLRLGQRVEIFTGNPMSRVDRDLRPFTHTHSFLHVLAVLNQRLPSPLKTTWWQNQDMETLGRWLARSIDPETTDILDGLDGLGPAAGRLMKCHGKAWICNRGSSHILTQKALLEEEHRRWGGPGPYFNPGHLERCLAEYAEADAIVVPSDFAQRSFVEQGIPSEKLYICPYGVELSMFHPMPKADSKFRVLFVGSASLRKGVGYLFEALRPLVKRGFCELWLVGGIESAAKPLLAKNQDLFAYKGRQPRATLASVYSQGSVLVMPSIEEGLALVQAQAMACGIPVIATTNTGAENLFSDGIEGFIVPIRDPLAIRDKVEWMIGHVTERARMGAAALERVKDLGGWNRYGELCLAMYHEILARKGGMA
ncbi:MAG: glycosyltransferase family 4 protein [Terriglobia bacterium]